jgi:phosphate starvation-inducible protein PhoH
MSRLKRKQQKELVFYKNTVENQLAMIEGPIKKKWTKHDMKFIQPITESQRTMCQLFYQGDHILAYGSAGTGKSLIALYLAIADVLDPSKPQNQLVIVRSAVATRDQGFLPGSLDEKLSVFEGPYHDIFSYLFNRNSTYEDMKKAGVIKFVSSSYIRGLTWDNAMVVVDEVENFNMHEISSVMTRLGDHSRIILAGDLKQTDLLKSNRDTTGMHRLIEICNRMPEVSLIEFTQDDIVRSGFVKSWIIASEI